MTKEQALGLVELEQKIYKTRKKREILEEVRNSLVVFGFANLATYIGTRGFSKAVSKDTLNIISGGIATSITLGYSLINHEKYVDDFRTQQEVVLLRKLRKELGNNINRFENVELENFYEKFDKMVEHEIQKQKTRSSINF